MKVFECYSVLQPDYCEERNKKFLLIWRDLPFWMVVDNESYHVINLLNGHHDLDEITRKISYNPIFFQEKKRELIRFLENLSKAGLIKNHKKKENNRIYEDNQPILENITINITKKCNLRCKHCYIQNYEDKAGFSFESFSNFIYEAKKYNLLKRDSNIAILGGEPLLKKEKALKIAELGQNLGLDVIVSTNGHLIDLDFAKKARSYNLTVQVSLEGSKAEINDEIRGKGSFIKAINGVKLLIKHRVHNILSMVVHSTNIGDVEQFFLMGKRLGVNEVRFINLKKMGSAKCNLLPIHRSELIVAIQKLFDKYEYAQKMLTRDYLTIMKKTCIQSNKLSYCGTGLKTVLIDSDGSIYPCPNHCSPKFNCGNINKDSFKDIWLNSPILKKIQATYNINSINDECPKCIVKYWCKGGCRGETFENTASMSSKATGCREIYSSIIETFWLLSGEKIIKKL